MARGGAGGLDLGDALEQRIAGLTPERRAVFVQLLGEEGRRIRRSRSADRTHGEAVFPLSFAQERLWFLYQLAPESPVYNIHAPLPLGFAADARVLEQCLKEIARRHEILRTRFVVRDGTPVQVVAPAATVPLAITDLGALAPDALQDALSKLSSRETQQSFDLTAGPLLRARLVRLGPRRSVLMLTIHHIVSDGWSMDILVAELATLYQTFAAGRPSPLPELPIQYADYACWQREWLRGEVLAQQLDYWRRQLDGAPAILELPADRRRRAGLSLGGARRKTVLSHGLAEALSDLGRRENASLFMVLLAAFKVLLHRYTGKTDLVLGTPIANRNHKEIEGLIGFFINTLVLRSDVSGDPSFRAYLGSVRQVALDAYAHQDLPFERLVEELQPKRDLSHNPLFQITCQLTNTRSAAKPQQPAPDSLRIEVDKGTADVDLALDFRVEPTGLVVQFEHRTDLFDGARIERMLGHLLTLLESVAADPDRPVSQLPLLTAGERTTLLERWNDTAAPYPRDLCVAELFEQQAARTPDAIAVVADDAVLTYAALDRQANQLAHRLQAAGVGPDVLVAIAMERSADLIVALLAVLKAGGAYVPLDPDYPRARLAWMLADAEPPVLLTQAHLVARLPASAAIRLVLDDPAERAATAAFPQTRPACRAGAGNLAYVMYTSGSTGRPKGVMVEHRGVCNYLLATQRALPLHESDCVLQRYSIGFDPSVSEIFGTLLSGAKLAVTDARATYDVEHFAASLEHHGVTVLDVPPAVLELLLQDRRFVALPSLRRVICGGDVLPADLERKFFTSLTAELYNFYGPTEASIGATLWRCDAGTSDRANVPIGRPIANTRVYILDAHLEPVPIGIPGELYIGGDGVARGYLNRSELTAEHFLANPFAPGRLYRTGDLARYRGDGAIEFLGRCDDQVKIRGFRIEPGEVEVALGEHPDLRAAAVVSGAAEGGEKQLVAYVVPAGERRPAAEELRRFLAQRLPDYMIPAVFMQLDQLPVTPNGKLDRARLPAPTNDRPQLETVYAAPATELERRIVALWLRLLDRREIGVNDNFFDLGGHSLLMVRMQRALQEELERPVKLVNLFQFPTIRALAQHLARAALPTPSAAATPAFDAVRERVRKQQKTHKQRISKTKSAT